MTTYVFFLGRQPELSLVELASLCETQHLGTPRASGHLAWLETSKTLPDNFIDQLGGTDRIAILVTTFPSFPTAEQVVEALSPLPDKWMLGLSTYHTSPPTSLKKFAIEIKKAARSHNAKVKFVTPAGKSTQLNAAQVAFNKLDVAPNMELTFIQHENQIALLKTLQIQDIVAYEKRDTGKPARDPRSGMLPPKLAQIMLNIAIGKLPEQLRQAPIKILDPFCGSGVVLQEGWLTDQAMYGSDASLDAIEASKANLDWLAKEFTLSSSLAPTIIARDVTNTFPGAWKQSFAAIVTEPYLGPPVKVPLSPSLAENRIKELAALYRPAFQNFHSLLQKDGVVVFIFPVFFTPDGWFGFPQNIIDGLSKIGYRLQQLSDQTRGLVYKRPDALVGRELTVWQKQ